MRAFWCLATAAARCVETTVFPVPPLGENTVTTRARLGPAASCDSRAAGSVADRERDALGGLREQHDVGDVRVERVVEQRGILVLGEQDDRRLRDLADRLDLLLQHRAAEHGMHDDVRILLTQAGGCSRSSSRRRR